MWKEVSDRASFCPYCGTVVQNKAEIKNSNENLQNDVSKFLTLLEEKTYPMPEIHTKRNYSTRIASDAAWLGNGINFPEDKMAKALIKFMRINVQQLDFFQFHKSWIDGISYALNDFANKKTGDFYYVEMSDGRLHKSIACIVKITESNGQYTYITGVIGKSIEL